MELIQAQKIYFLGIGGIGMSALARYFHLKGKTVSGYDRSRSIVTRGLEELGIVVHYESDPSHVQGQDMLIYTPAISVEDVEYQAANLLNIPILKRSEALGKISASYQTLAVAGTHGKTTTSSMLTHVLRSCGLDCTAFLGGISRNLESNFVFGNSPWMVAEADEFDRSFLRLFPQKSVITAIDPDHLDIYETADQMRSNYQAFANQSGSLLVHTDVSASINGDEKQTYGIDSGVFQAKDLRFGDLSTHFHFEGPDIRLENLQLNMPGRHNVLNMTAALAIASELDLDHTRIPTAVQSFKGIYRRFECLHHSENLTYIDDYAHHPKEIDAVIETARKLFPKRQLVVIFQPHLFSRTRDFMQGFAKALSQADSTLLMDIYPAREAPIAGINSQRLLEMMPLKNKALVGRAEVLDALDQKISKPAVLLSLGAGDIDREVNGIKKWIKGKDSH